MPKYQFLVAPDHGWLRVPWQEVKQAGVLRTVAAGPALFWGE